jgi:putative DNA primase/helicase
LATLTGPCYGFRSEGGIGKTFFSLGVAYAVSSGGRFLRWQAPNPQGVLFIDGEIPGVVLQECLARLALSCAEEPQAPLRIITPDLQEKGIIDLAKSEDQAELSNHLKDVSLIIIDNLSTLVRTGRENDAEGWLPIQAWALAQRAAGRSVLFIHHSGKGGSQRGTSRREDVLDTVINFRQPGDYSPDQGAVFEVHFEKALGIYGDDTKPFEAKLLTDSTGRQEWTVLNLERSTAERLAALLTDGIPQKEIPEMLGLTKGAVSKAKKKAKALGLIMIEGSKFPISRA